jgi:hypothetical protein
MIRWKFFLKRKCGCKKKLHKKRKHIWRHKTIFQEPIINLRIRIMNSRWHKKYFKNLNMSTKCFRTNLLTQRKKLLI